MAAVNWQALGYSGPPITGDPAAVRQLGQGLDRAAATIDGQISRLDGVKVDQIWHSDAAVGFNEVSAKLPEMLGQAGTRYREAGAALVTYADKLHGAIGDMNHWGRVAQDAHDELHGAKTTLATERAADPKASSLPGLEGRVEEAAERLRVAKVRIGEAVTAKDTAARNATTSINEAADILRNTGGLFKALGNLVSKAWKNLPAIASALRGVAAVLNIAAIALIWVPVLGPILGTAALAVNATVLLVDTVLAVSGRGSWTNVGWSALAVGLSGFGAFANAGGRIAREGARLAKGKPTFPGGPFGPGAATQAPAQLGKMGKTLTFGVPGLKTSPHYATAANGYRPWRPALDVGKELKMVRGSGANGRPPGFFKNASINFQGHWGNVVGVNGAKAGAYQWADISRRALGIGNPENLWEYKPAGLNFPRRFRDAERKWV